MRNIEASISIRNRFLTPLRVIVNIWNSLITQNLRSLIYFVRLLAFDEHCVTGVLEQTWNYLYSSSYLDTIFLQVVIFLFCLRYSKQKRSNEEVVFYFYFLIPLYTSKKLVYYPDFSACISTPNSFLFSRVESGPIGRSSYHIRRHLRDTIRFRFICSSNSSNSSNLRWKWFFHESFYE